MYERPSQSDIHPTLIRFSNPFKVKGEGMAGRSYLVNQKYTPNFFFKLTLFVLKILRFAKYSPRSNCTEKLMCKLYFLNFINFKMNFDFILCNREMYRVFTDNIHLCYFQFSTSLLVTLT